MPANRPRLIVSDGHDMKHSLQTALMSAPDSSSLVMTNSSMSTSSAKDIRDVCNLKMCLLVFVSGRGNSDENLSQHEVSYRYGQTCQFSCLFDLDESAQGQDFQSKN